MAESCNCCNQTDAITPLVVNNPPGLSQLRYRIGTHNAFMQSMIARLSRSCPGDEADCKTNSGPFPLHDRLKTRDVGDPSIAWLDAWATVADVLTFYQERIANEGYLGTALRTRSLHELSSLVGYTPRPGLSSSVLLAFEVEKPPVTPEGLTVARRLPKGGVLIPAGTAVESTPSAGSDEESQTFETSDDFIARESWNAIQLRKSQPQCITLANVCSLERIYLKGTGLGLKVNDLVYIDLDGLAAPVGYPIRQIIESQETQVTQLVFPENELSAYRMYQLIRQVIAGYPGIFPVHAVAYGDTAIPAYSKEVKRDLDEALVSSGGPRAGIRDLDAHFSKLALDHLLSHVDVSERLAAMAQKLDTLLAPTGILKHDDVTASYQSDLSAAIDRYAADDQLATALHGQLNTTDPPDFRAKTLAALHANTQEHSDAVAIEMGSEHERVLWGTQVIDGAMRVMASQAVTNVTIEVSIVAGSSLADTLGGNLAGWQVASPTPGLGGSLHNLILHRVGSDAVAAPDIERLMRGLTLTCWSSGTRQVEIVIRSNAHCVGVASKRVSVGNLDDSVLAGAECKNCTVILGPARQSLGAFELGSPSYVGAVKAKIELLNVGDGRLSSHAVSDTSLAGAMNKLSRVRFSAVGLPVGPRWIRVLLFRRGERQPSAALYREVIVCDDNRLSGTVRPVARRMLNRLSRLYSEASNPRADLLSIRNRFIRDAINPYITTRLQDLQSDILKQSTLFHVSLYGSQIIDDLMGSTGPGTVHDRLDVDLRHDFERAEKSALSRLRAMLAAAMRALQELKAEYGSLATKADQLHLLIDGIENDYRSLNTLNFRKLTRELPAQINKQVKSALELDNRYRLLAAKTKAVADGILKILHDMRVRLLTAARDIAEQYVLSPDASPSDQTYFDNLIATQANLNGWTIADQVHRTSALADEIALHYTGVGFDCSLPRVSTNAPTLASRLIQFLGIICPENTRVSSGGSTLNQILQALSRASTGDPSMPGVPVLSNADPEPSTEQFHQIVSSLARNNLTEHESIYDLMRGARIETSSLQPRVFVLRTQCNLFGWNSPPTNQTLSDQDVKPLIQGLQKGITPPPPVVFPWPWGTYSFDWTTYVDKLKRFIEGKVKRYFKRLNPPVRREGPTPEDSHKAYLDGEFHSILPDDFIAIRKLSDSEPVPYRVSSVKIFPRADYRIRGNTTEVVLSNPWWDPFAHYGSPKDDAFETLRTTRVYCETLRLELAEEPLHWSTEHVGSSVCDATCMTTAPTSGTVTLELDTVVEGLNVGQMIAVQGQVVIDGRPTKEMRSELATIVGVRHEIRDCLFGDRFVTKLDLESLSHAYDRSSVRIKGNLVEATHGKSNKESIGDGEGARAFLKHQLTSSPLSQMPVPAPMGSRNEVSVFVEDVQWLEASDFVEAQPRSQIFVAKRDFSQQTTIVFGDGRAGARPPSGRDNIVARYRTGLGVRGNVPVGRINQFAGSTVGVTGVVNPLAATGGADPDDLSQTKTRAPLSVMAFDRLVSISDYHDFAVGFAGIGKAVAQAVAGTIELTIAAAHPGPIPESGKLYQNLLTALNHYGGPLQLTLYDRDLTYLVLFARVEIDPLHQWSIMESRLRQTLLATFSYDNAQFGRPLFMAQAYQAIQNTDGVVHAEIVKFDNVSIEEVTSPLAPDTLGRRTSIDMPLEQGKPARLCFLTPDVKGTLILERIAGP